MSGVTTVSTIQTPLQESAVAEMRRQVFLAIVIMLLALSVAGKIENAGAVCYEDGSCSNGFCQSDSLCESE